MSYIKVTVSEERWERLRELTEVPHNHYDGMNECSICDAPLLEADEEEQLQEVEIYEDGEYSHNVSFRYFTREQIERIREVQRNNAQ